MTMRALAASAAVTLGWPALAGATPPAQAAHGMVVTEQALATKVGVDVLAHGGNAMDAAIAVGYALAVTDPCCGNIGGGGFMLVHKAKGGDVVIDFREYAPRRATAAMYQDARGNVVAGRSTEGYLAAGVPGTVAGLEMARTMFATRSRSELMAPAIALAREGFTLTAGDASVLAPSTADFVKQPNVAAIFTRRDGTPLRIGDTLRQPQLARTLQAIDAGGADAFYRGDIAKRVLAASAANGGILELDDFAQYRALVREPLRCMYHGYQLLTAPPPSSGGVTLCEILLTVDAYPFVSYGVNSAPAIHADVEAERLAYADRNTYLGDPAFVKNPVERLLSPPYIAALQKRIGERATPSASVKGGLGPLERAQTTHYSIADRDGNAVSVTYTLNGSFGANVIASDTGFFLNNEMDDFTSKPGTPNIYGLVQGEANAIAPHKRPLSSMAPTIALRGGNVAIVVGSPGGSHIITVTLAVLQNIIDFGLNVQDAVDLPRVHSQWLPDTVYFDSGAVTPEVRANLTARGYTFSGQEQWGLAEAIVIDPQSGMFFGGSDRRRPDGLALGY